MFTIPEWTYTFHGHKSPFMPIGYRMGALAMQKLGVGRNKNHEMHVFSEMGIGHPQGCMQDGIMSVTGATFGKGMIEKLNYGKVAAIFWYPGKGAVRQALKPEFTDKLSPHEFFVYRKKGVEPSDIPEEVKEDIINMVLSASEDELFTVKELPDFSYSLVPGSFHKEKCDACGEYVFDRYLRRFQGVTMCIECAGYHHDEHVIHWPIK